MICTILGTLMAASLIAQDNTNNLPAIPPPVTSPAAESAPGPAPAPTMPAPTAPAKPAPRHKRIHHTVKKRERPAVAEHKVNLTPGPAEVTASELVVRGQAGLKGEVVARLHKGETVNVLEQIDLAKHEAGEPSQWAKISYPSNADVWVSAKYVSNGTVSTKKLNLRAGPGENYSVVGVLDQGTPVTEVETRGSWMKIQPPADAYAFVAAKYLSEEVPPPAPSPVAPMPAPTPTAVPEQPSIVATPPPPSIPQPPPAPATPPVRIVEHQGIVGPVGSIIAPTDYKLYDEKTKQDIDFLYPTSPNMNFRDLVDDEVIVTGEEGVEAQWPNTPIMAVQNIQVIRTNVIKRLDLTPPRQRH